MTDWQAVWLGVIAIAVSLMALIQIVVLIGLARLAFQAVAGVRDLRKEIRPLIDKVNRIADDVNRISGIAVAQAERVQTLMNDTASRIDDTLGAARRVVMGPIRQGSAVMAAVRAIFSSLRGTKAGPARPSHHPHHDDEDPLFVG